MKRKKAKDSIEFHGKTVPLAAIGEMDYGDQNEILSKRGNAIQYIEEPTEEQKLIAVKQNGYAIRYIFILRSLKTADNPYKYCL